MHPVFADSFEIGHEPYFVTAEEEGSWMPKMSDSSKHLSEQMHWVMVDLEGVRRINQLEVSFEEEPDTLEKSKKNLPQTIVAELRSDLEWEKVILKRKNRKETIAKSAIRQRESTLLAILELTGIKPNCL